MEVEGVRDLCWLYCGVSLSRCSRVGTLVLVELLGSAALKLLVLRVLALLVGGKLLDPLAPPLLLLLLLLLGALVCLDEDFPAAALAVAVAGPGSFGALQKARTEGCLRTAFVGDADRPEFISNQSLIGCAHASLRPLRAWKLTVLANLVYLVWSGVERSGAGRDVA